MREPKIILLLALISCSIKLYATNYYVSNSGNDSNDGLTTLTPWQTVSKLNATTFLPGDSILFEANGIFRGQWNFSGTGDALSSIYIGMYGSGNIPVISGAETATNWINYSGNIYQSSFLQPCTCLFCDNERMTSARYPNSGFLTIQSSSIADQFIDATLTQSTGYWNGATVRMRMNDLIYENNIVSGFTGGTVSLQTNMMFPISAGYGYYFDNLFSELDSASEWFYDAALSTIYFLAPNSVDPNTLPVEASVYDYGILFPVGCNNVTVENIQFEKQTKAGVTSSNVIDHLSIMNCHFNHEGERGVELLTGASHLSIVQSSFHNCISQGISGSQFVSARIDSNSFRNIGMIASYGFVANNQGFAIVITNSDSVNISRNSIDTTGSGAIDIYSCTNSIIEKNISSHNGEVFNNFPVISITGSPLEAITVQNNFIFYPLGNNEATPHNNLFASGIQINDSCSQCIVNHNTIVGSSGTGILFPPETKGYSLKQNLIYGCSISQVDFVEGSNDDSTRSNILVKNILYCLHENQIPLRIIFKDKDYAPAFLDSNYYFNPYDFFSVKSSYLIPSNADTNRYYTLNQWKAYYHNDINSKNSFLFRNRYEPVGTSGPELISNGTFTNNLNGWTNGIDTSVSMLLDNSTPLDGGCLKLTLLNNTEDIFSNIVSSPFSIDSGVIYKFQCSDYSVTSQNFANRLFNTSDFSISSLNRFFPFDANRLNYLTTFLSEKSCDPCGLDLYFSFPDSVLWLDNFSLTSVTANFVEPTKKSRLFTNVSSVPLTYFLADSLFFDLDQNEITNQITVLPYSSIILIFDSTLITGINGADAFANTLSVYPNPISTNGILHIKINDMASSPTTISIYDIQGRLFFISPTQHNGNEIIFNIPPILSDGVYFLSLKNSSGIYIARVVILNER